MFLAVVGRFALLAGETASENKELAELHTDQLIVHYLECYRQQKSKCTLVVTSW